MRRFSKSFIRASTFSLLTFLALFALPACRHKNRSPNVILIVVDSLRADYLGCYGFDGPISPAIDELAAHSVRFDSAITTAVWSRPAVASLFTALSPDALGASSGSGEISTELAFSSSVLTMAESFRSAGYHTAAFVGNPWVSASAGFDRGFDLFDSLDGQWDHPDGRVGSTHALRWLERQRTAPFFVFLHYMDVHGPYLGDGWVPPEIETSGTLGLDRPLTDAELNRRPPYLIRNRPANFRDAREGVNDWKTRYARAVWLFDRQFGAFMRALKKAHRLDDTIVVLTSDHGEELLDHGNWEHSQSLYRETIRVPLIIRPARGTGAGRVISNLVSLRDVMPTLARLAGLNDEIPGMSERDLSPFLSGDARGGDPHVITVADISREVRSRSICDARFHLIIPAGSSNRPELFDTVSDPWEKSNVAAEHRDVVQRLTAILDADVQRWEKIRAAPGPATANRSELEELKSAGPFQ